MTPQEFEGGWKVLTAVWPKADERDRRIYFGVLGGLSARTWGAVVKAVLAECTFFPPPAEFLEYAYAVERSRAEAAAHVKYLDEPKPDIAGHPLCPMRQGESPVAYVARLAEFLDKGESGK